MKIVMLTRHCCIRVIKEALPLISLGHEVHLITNKITQFSDLFTTVTAYQDVDQLYNAVKLHGDADIFHAHNEPSWFVTVVKETLSNVPIILDIHDSHVLRRTDEELREINDPEYFRISVDERNNFQLADGLVYVCNPMVDKVGGEFKLDQPYIVLPSYVPERFYRIDFLRWIGGLVYEGRIDLPDELPKTWDFFQYSNYIDLAKKARELGIDFHVYTPRQNEKVLKAYKDIAYLQTPQKLDRLIKCLGSHDWGLVGNIYHFEEWENALPNKLFEYLAGCVPVVAINARECSNLIDEYKIGISVESLEELTERWKEHREARKNVIKFRKEFTMERHISSLVEFYKGFI